MIVINLFGAPGAGKSTAAAEIFAELKKKGVNCELVTEFAKDKVWEESGQAFHNQAYIFGEQYFRLSRLEGKVDVAVTDSPLLLSIVYNTDKRLGKEFAETVFKVFSGYENWNFLLRGGWGYSEIGRRHKKGMVRKEDIERLLREWGVDFREIGGAEEILEQLKKGRRERVLEWWKKEKEKRG